MKPLVVVTTHPIQYQAPLYAALTQADVPVHVLFLNDQGLRLSWDPGFQRELAWDIPLLEGYEYEFVRNWSPSSQVASPFGLVNPGLMPLLNPKRFAAVLVHGYRSASMLAAVATAKARRLPVLYRAESSGPLTRPDRRVGLAFRRMVDACLAIGTRNRDFYLKLGMPQARIILAPYAVDNARFQAASGATTRPAARAQLGLRQDATVLAFVGKLVSAKRPDLLLDAVIRLHRPDVQLVLAGEGELYGALDARARASGCDVRFLGFRNQGEIATVYKSADLLVLPSSHEPWGLVVNEAMNFGVPALVSDCVGSAPDLVIPGRTGAVFQADSLDSLTKELGGLLASGRLERLGTGALSRINDWGFAQCIEGFRRALELVGAAA
jgi:glycosyltransferase involved in cell wall biosynthesis